MTAYRVAWEIESNAGSWTKSNLEFLLTLGYEKVRKERLRELELQRKREEQQHRLQLIGTVTAANCCYCYGLETL